MSMHQRDIDIRLTMNGLQVYNASIYDVTLYIDDLVETKNAFIVLQPGDIFNIVFMLRSNAYVPSNN